MTHEAPVATSDLRLDARGVLALALALVPLACGAQPSADRADTTAPGITTAPGMTSADSSDPDTGGGPTGGPGEDVTSAGDGAEAPKFDIGDGSLCETKPEGLYCEGETAVQCGPDGQMISSTVCTPEQCVEGEGCVPCTAGQWTCKGPRVMTCNVDGEPYWEQIAVCDPAAGQFCDISLPGCSPLAPIGDVAPTGEYYLYSTFSPAAEGFNTISDVDSYGNRIWFTAWLGNQLTVAGYDVELVDSDGDGTPEPHQHPDSADEPGPIEERVFTFATSFPISNDGAIPHQMELYATSTSIFWAGPNQITEYDLATGTTAAVAPKSPWIGSMVYGYLAFLGYDDVNDVWYSGNESYRRVFQYDAETATWGYAFEFPVLAGDHMDGMDVVTDPSTGTPYVYVSDMTSNFIGQYRHDPVQGWVQENMFSYNENTGVPVEGFGFGALAHFWVGGWNQNSFYEIGGGDLTEFLDPAG